MIVEKDEHRFFELKQYVSIGNDEVMLIQHFVRGLNAHIRGGVCVFEPKTMEMVVAKARLVEQNLALALARQIGVQIASDRP